MSTTKHLILTERPGTHIEIVNADGRPAIIVTDNYKSTMAYFEPEDGAKTALAVLEAAGYEEGSEAKLGSSELLASYGVTKLRQAVQAQEGEESEAKAQAELEAEALELYNASCSSRGFAQAHEWSQLYNSEQEQWLAVARRAREMRAEK